MKKFICTIVFMLLTIVGFARDYESPDNPKEEFAQWFITTFVDSLSRGTLLKHCYHDIYFYKDKKGWVSDNRRRFVNQNFEQISDFLSKVPKEGLEHYVVMSQLSWFSYKKNEFRKYFDESGEAMEWKYPVMSIDMRHEKGKIYFDFLKTDEGYKLLRITVRGDNRE